jgi:hypothetical protein
VPRVASSVLNHAITRLEKDLSSVVQFEIHFARDNYVEVDCVSSVHTRMIRFQNVNHPRQFMLNLFESRRGADLIDGRYARSAFPASMPAGLELVLRDGRRLRISQGVQEETLRAVLAALEP